MSVLKIIQHSRLSSYLLYCIDKNKLVQVKMAEETVKRVTGVNPLLWARPDMDGDIIKADNLNYSAYSGLPPNQRVERVNLLSEQVNRKGMQNQSDTNPNLFETLPNWNHKH